MKSLFLNRLGCIFIAFFFSFSLLFAQNPPPAKTNKAMKASEDVNKKTEEIKNSSDAMNQQVQQASGNMQATSNNAKAVVQVFEPILRLRLKKQAGSSSTEMNTGQDGTTVQPTDPYQSQGQGNQPAQPDNISYTDGGSPQAMQNQEVYVEDIQSGVPIASTGEAYNTDGTANLGNQNNSKFGCYLDIRQGLIMDEVDAADQTRAVDIMFTATDYYGSAPMYAFLTPAYVKNDFFSNYYFRGAKYKDANIPVKLWEEVNETEIALTNLTPEKFEKIRDNNQLMAVVKQTGAFKDKFESRTKLDGKILAIKTEMGDRTAYGLLYIVSHYGTTGENGYLKIKLKVTGFDANGDGNADSFLYSH